MLKKVHLLLFVATCLFVVMINSCKKDLRTDQQNAVSDPAVAQAKSWYESTFPASTAKQTTQSVTADKDLNQFIKPDWNHTYTYTKLSKGVIEMPVDPSHTINSVFKNLATNKVYGNKNNSRSSFLFLKDSSGYSAYIMTLIGDSSYLKNDASKLAHNTYRKRDVHFSGLVLYFTPQGKYINGYRYLNGQLITNSSAKSNDNKLNVNTSSPVCTDWFLDTYQDGALISEHYLYTSCSSGGDGSGSGGGTPPAPCTPVPPGQSDESVNKTKVNGISVQQTQPQDPPVIDPSDGFPPPSGSTPPPCVTGGGGGVPVKVTTPNFGLDKNCLNCRIADANFDNLLNYLDTQGITYLNPYNDVWTVDGVQYTGQTTDIKQPNGDIVHYFSPDVNSGPFEIGIEYNLGTSVDGSNRVTTTNNIILGGISVDAPSSYLGNGSATYTPTGGGGAVLTFAQHQAMVAADNQRLINLMNQEDAKDDAAMSPCHGTFRNGNVMWPGTAEHWLIQFDYMANNPAALREYFIPGSSSKLTGAAGYADIADPSTNQMFEIKPDNTAGQTAGAAEVQVYVAQGNALCPPPNGGVWAAGGNYPTRYLPDPRNPSNVLQARLFSNGVIVYASLSKNNQPIPQPVALPQNLADKLKNLFQNIKANPSTQQQQIITFVRQNPKIVPYLKSASAGIIIGTILEDIASDGIGILDDWESFLIARTLWRVGNGIVIM